MFVVIRYSGHRKLIRFSFIHWVNTSLLCLFCEVWAIFSLYSACVREGSAGDVTSPPVTTSACVIAWPSRATAVASDLKIHGVGVADEVCKHCFEFAVSGGNGGGDCERRPLKEKPHLEVAEGWMVGLELVLNHCELGTEEPGSLDLRMSQEVRL